MPEERIAETIGVAVDAVSDQPTEVKAAVAAAAATASIPPPAIPPPPSTGALWLILVTGLVVAVLASLAGVIWVVVDGKASTNPDVIVTIFTTTLAGLIGLFVKAPSSTT